MNAQRARLHLTNFELRRLFIDELGWDRYGGALEITIDGQVFVLDGVAQKRGMVAFVSVYPQDAPPDYATRRKIERQATQSVHEHLIIYTNVDHSTQIWQWVRRQPGEPTAVREQTYAAGQQGEALIQRLAALAFSLEEEEGLTIVDVAQRARAAFDVERVTRRFYDRFKLEHDAFLGFISGLSCQADREWYASVTLNRLMFIYFVQKKGFLDDDRDYLRNRLHQMKALAGDDHFLSFYRHFLLRLFHEGLAQRTRTSDLDALLGTVPYLNGGLFDVHELERANPAIEIPDDAFERLFDFFDSYQWHLDDRPLRADNEINPDVLGYIFEKYVNQKQMGAYYSKEDITGYITANTVVLAVLETFLADPAGVNMASIVNLMASDPDRYIHGALMKGVDAPLPPEIQAGTDDPSKRSAWAQAAGAPHGLAAETWRDVVSRRERYAQVREALADHRVGSMSELVALNVNVRQLLQDVADGIDEAPMLLSFYRILERLTVLDPACGSGAFLFAVVNVLEPIYESVLDRMAVLLLDAPLEQDEHAAFRRVLTEMDAHPTPTAFILKAIIVNNLYGVDIMAEAVEICKLRLFLRLVSQVDRSDRLEPLPDIDFNVRAGNSLVGFTDPNAVAAAARERLDVAGVLPAIEELLTEVDRHAGIYRELQRTERGGGAQEKVDLTDALARLGSLLDAYVAADYGVVTASTGYSSWRKAHDPFHWMADFHGIMMDGGFDVVIGNPPYIELARIRAYTTRGYATQPCGNVYALFVERAMALLKNGGRMGMIMPMSIACTERMVELRDVLDAATSSAVISHYSGDANPSTLFEGVKGRLSILLARSGGNKGCKWYSSAYTKWFADERPRLFENVAYGAVNVDLRYLGLLPKLGDSKAAGIWQKLLTNAALSRWFGEGSRTLYVHRVITQYIKCFDFVPYFWNEAEGVKKSDDYKPYTFSNDEIASCALAMLNSSTFWFYFVVLGDGFHCGREFVSAFPAGLDSMAPSQARRLCNLAEELTEDLKRHAVRRRAQSQRTGQVEYDEFWPRHSKGIMDEIDAVLAGHYGFNDGELDYIQNYAVKYRVGRQPE